MHAFKIVRRKSACMTQIKTSKLNDSSEINLSMYSKDRLKNENFYICQALSNKIEIEVGRHLGGTSKRIRVKDVMHLHSAKKIIYNNHF